MRQRELHFRAMASPCRLLALGELSDTALDQALAQAEAEVRRIEAHYSRYRADSVIGRLNASAGRAEGIEVDEECASLLRFAEHLRRESGGLFDIRCGALRGAWNFDSGRLPEPDLLQGLLARMQAAEIVLDGHRVVLPAVGMAVDLGGIGKEYAADRAAALLLAAGVQGGLVDLGGDLRVLGPNARGEPWRLGVAHPRRPGEAVGELSLRRGALATSGDYERFMDVGGQRYCHILDPRTGWPPRQWQSVSVMAPTCLAAGSLTTVAMLMGEQAPAFLRQQGVSALLVDAQGRLHSVEASA